MKEEMDVSYSVDHLLVAIIKLVETGELDEPAYVTLLAGGMLISGQVIPSREFLDPDGESEANKTENEEAKNQQKDEELSYDRRYIHLKDAKFLHGTNQIPAEGGFLWRGKLTAIDGFTYSVFDIRKSERKPFTVTVNGKTIEAK